MIYTIQLQQMEFRAYHGCYELERKVGNRFAVDMEITTELGDLAENDDVTKAVSYLTVYEIVREQMGITRHTIEAVAAQIIEAVRGSFPQIVEISCKVSKIAPPLGGKLDRVSVTLRG
ncbi:MAG: dihydroneopterin aldolase [Rikenellaceae bacterium]